jgi:hypothetical protein
VVASFFHILFGFFWVFFVKEREILSGEIFFWWNFFLKVLSRINGGVIISAGNVQARRATPARDQAHESGLGSGAGAP